MNRSSSSFSQSQLKQAIEWFVFLQAEQCLAEDVLRFETWLAKNECHRAAYAEAERVWTSMDNLKFMPVPGLADARAAKPRKTATALVSSLAFIIFAGSLIGGLWQDYSAESTSYATRIGEHRRIELADNSHIDLNTNTRVLVKISFLQRKVVLTEGEALFDVSHSRLRPFTVHVGDLQIRDVGTRFNVRKQSNGATISVLEGEVELNDGKNVINEHINAGSQRNYSETRGLGQQKTVETDQLTAWLKGQLIFKHTPLSLVTAELERYHPVRFSFSDPKLAQETVSGTFNATDMEPFLHALGPILSIEAKRNSQQIQLRRIQKN